MRHLYNCQVELWRLSGTIADGTPTLTWAPVDTMIDEELGVPGQFMCRLDLSFVRPGKDAPMPAVAGRAPDRVGVMFFDLTTAVLAGDRVHTVAGPVTGVFEIRAIPDPALDNLSAHHMEVQIVEVAQALAGVFPSSTPRPVTP